MRGRETSIMAAQISGTKPEEEAELATDGQNRFNIVYYFKHTFLNVQCEDCNKETLEIWTGEVAHKKL